MCVNFIFKRLAGDPSQIQLKDTLQFLMPSSSAWKWVNEVRSWVNQSWETPPYDATHSPPTHPLPYRDPFNRGDVLQNKQIGSPHIP